MSHDSRCGTPRCQPAHDVVTLCTIPSDRDGDVHCRQSNALASWRRLPGVSILMCCSPREEASLQRRFPGVRTATLPTTPSGVPLVSGVIADAGRLASTDLVAFVNSDIILEPGFVAALAQLAEIRRPLLATARRWELAETPNLVAAESPAAWSGMLRQAVEACTPGRRSALDLFVWRRDTQVHCPPLAVGRRGWDNWFLWRASVEGWLTIDMSPLCRVIHQTHSFENARHAGGISATGERDWNMRSIGGWGPYFSLDDCRWILSEHGLRQRRGIRATAVSPPFIRGYTALLAAYRSSRAALDGVVRRIA